VGALYSKINPLLRGTPSSRSSPPRCCLPSCARPTGSIRTSGTTAGISSLSVLSVHPSLPSLHQFLTINYSKPPSPPPSVPLFSLCPASGWWVYADTNTVHPLSGKGDSPHRPKLPGGVQRLCLRSMALTLSGTIQGKAGLRWTESSHTRGWVWRFRLSWGDPGRGRPDKLIWTWLSKYGLLGPRENRQPLPHRLTQFSFLFRHAWQPARDIGKEGRRCWGPRAIRRPVRSGGSRSAEARPLREHDGKLTAQERNKKGR
jgi:hypothetical protein